MTQRPERRTFVAGRTGGTVSALWLAPSEPLAALVLGHGAGAGMEHSFLATLAGALAREGVATFRYQFPYMEKLGGSGWGRPDPGPVLQATVRRAVETAREATDRIAEDLPLFAGGKSMGGRMTSLAESRQPLGVQGLVFYGFPLHPAGKPSTDRAGHLASTAVPLLFLQGTRDRLADLDLLRGVLEPLGGRAELAVIDTADHGFAVLKRSGRSAEEVVDDLARTTRAWIDRQSAFGSL